MLAGIARVRAFSYFGRRQLSLFALSALVGRQPLLPSDVRRLRFGPIIKFQASPTPGFRLPRRRHAIRPRRPPYAASASEIDSMRPRPPLLPLMRRRCSSTPPCTICAYQACRNLDYKS